MNEQTSKALDGLEEHLRESVEAYAGHGIAEASDVFQKQLDAVRELRAIVQKAPTAPPIFVRKIASDQVRLAEIREKMTADKVGNVYSAMANEIAVLRKIVSDARGTLLLYTLGAATATAAEAKAKTEASIDAVNALLGNGGKS